MVWSHMQRYRLAIEKEKLEQHFRNGITWIDPTGDTKVEVHLTSNADNPYVLRIYIPADFPNSCPKLVVVSPDSLRLHNGLPIPELSDTFHTLQRIDDFLSICHFYPPDWTADNTLYQIFMKGRIWIEAYEAHLQTGKNMDDYLGHMQFTPDPENPWMADDYVDPLYSSIWDSDDDDDDGIYDDEDGNQTDFFRSLSLRQRDGPSYLPTTSNTDRYQQPAVPVYETPHRYPLPYVDPNDTPLPTSSLPPRQCEGNPPSQTRGFRPAGAIDIFSPFRDAGNISLPSRRGPAPPVQPKPKRDGS